MLELTDGIGVDSAMECVGTAQSMTTVMTIARPGSTVGVVGVPHGVDVPFPDIFFRNIGWHGGPAPARRYIPELLDDVLAGTIEPGLVLDFDTDLDHIADAYEAMDPPGHQFARADRSRLMATWTANDIDSIGTAEELELSSIVTTAACART